MRIRLPLLTAMLAVIALSASGGCNYCGAEEERSVSVSSNGPLQITQADATRSVGMSGRVSEFEIATSPFDELFEIVAGGGTAQRSAVLTLQPNGYSQDDLMLFAIALPGELRQGERLAVGGVFDVPFQLSTESAFGSRTLKTAGRPDVAFRTGSYTFPPSTFHTTYAATGGEGFVEVVRRSGGSVELLLDVTLRNAAGEPVVIRGTVQAQTERFTPSCIS